MNPDGSVWIGGSARSPDVPIVGGGAQGQEGVFDAFLARFGRSGALRFSTYLGGRLTPPCYPDIALCPDGSLAIVGECYDIPVARAYDDTFNGSTDAFVAKCDANGRIPWATYFGGGYFDGATACAVDQWGGVCETGNTPSSDFPTPNGFDRTLGSSEDVSACR